MELDLFSVVLETIFTSQTGVHLSLISIERFSSYKLLKTTNY